MGLLPYFAAQPEETYVLNAQSCRRGDAISNGQQVHEMNQAWKCTHASQSDVKHATRVG